MTALVPFQRIFVSGHRGMVGQAVCRRLSTDPSLEIVTRTREQLDLTNEAATRKFFESERPNAVVFSAARVGGNPCQQHLSRRILCREHQDGGELDHRCL